MIGNIITLRILMIGNSFSVCVGKDLPYIAQSVPGHQVVLTSAYIGGCSLERHWNNVVESEENPDAKQYAVHSWANTAQGVAQVDARGSINDLLKNGQWDIVTSQPFQLETRYLYALRRTARRIHSQAPAQCENLDPANMGLPRR